jgi:ankyrin repeat protein
MERLPFWTQESDQRLPGSDIPIDRILQRMIPRWRRCFFGVRSELRGAFTNGYSGAVVLHVVHGRRPGRHQPIRWDTSEIVKIDNKWEALFEYRQIRSLGGVVPSIGSVRKSSVAAGRWRGLRVPEAGDVGENVRESLWDHILAEAADWREAPTDGFVRAIATTKKIIEEIDAFQIAGGGSRTTRTLAPDAIEGEIKRLFAGMWPPEYRVRDEQRDDTLGNKPREFPAGTRSYVIDAEPGRRSARIKMAVFRDGETFITLWEGLRPRHVANPRKWKSFQPYMVRWTGRHADRTVEYLAAVFGEIEEAFDGEPLEIVTAGRGHGDFHARNVLIGVRDSTTIQPHIIDWRKYTEMETSAFYDIARLDVSLSVEWFRYRLERDADLQELTTIAHAISVYLSRLVSPIGFRMIIEETHRQWIDRFPELVFLYAYQFYLRWFAFSALQPRRIAGAELGQLTVASFYVSHALWAAQVTKHAERDSAELIFLRAIVDDDLEVLRAGRSQCASAMERYRCSLGQADLSERLHAYCATAFSRSVLIADYVFNPGPGISTRSMRRLRRLIPDAYVRPDDAWSQLEELVNPDNAIRYGSIIARSGAGKSALVAKWTLEQLDIQRDDGTDRRPVWLINRRYLSADAGDEVDAILFADVFNRIDERYVPRLQRLDAEGLKTLGVDSDDLEVSIDILVGTQPISVEMWKSRLQAHRAIVIFDGIDEVQSTGETPRVPDPLSGGGASTPGPLRVLSGIARYRRTLADTTLLWTMRADDWLIFQRYRQTVFRAVSAELLGANAIQIRLDSDTDTDNHTDKLPVETVQRIYTALQKKPGLGLAPVGPLPPEIVAEFRTPFELLLLCEIYDGKVVEPLTGDQLIGRYIEHKLGARDEPLLRFVERTWDLMWTTNMLSESTVNPDVGDREEIRRIFHLDEDGAPDDQPLTDTRELQSIDWFDEDTRRHTDGSVQRWYSVGSAVFYDHELYRMFDRQLPDLESVIGKAIEVTEILADPDATPLFWHREAVKILEKLFVLRCRGGDLPKLQFGFINVAMDSPEKIWRRFVDDPRPIVEAWKTGAIPQTRVLAFLYVLPTRIVRILDRDRSLLSDIDCGEWDLQHTITASGNFPIWIPVLEWIELFSEISDGCCDLVRSLCLERAINGLTPWMFASGTSARSLAILIRAMGGAATDYIGITGGNSVSPFHVAAQHCPEALQLLIQTAGDKFAERLQDRADGGWTPLHVAAQHNADAVRLLVEIVGEDLPELLNSTKDGGGTPFHVAAQHAPEALQVLIDTTANDLTNRLKEPDDAGWTPFHVAAAYNPDSLWVLIDNTDIELNARLWDREKSGATPFHAAAEMNSESLRILIRIVGDEQSREMLAAKTENGWTPLHHAAGKNPEALQLLVETAGDTAVDRLGDRTSLGETPYHIAADFNYKSMKVLVDNSGPELYPRINDPDNEGWTPFHIAVEKPKMLQLLVEHVQRNVDELIRHRSHGGWNSLHTAAERSPESVRILVEAAGDQLPEMLTKRTPKGFTPICIAAEHSSEALQVLIAAAGDDLSERLRDKAEKNWTPFHVAAQHNATALQVMIDAVGDRLVDYLSITARGDVTAFHIAAHANPDAFHRLVAAILQSDISPDVVYTMLTDVNENNYTPRDAALKAGNDTVVQTIDNILGGLAEGSDQNSE